MYQLEFIAYNMVFGLFQAPYYAVRWHTLPDIYSCF